MTKSSIVHNNMADTTTHTNNCNNCNNNVNTSYSQDAPHRKLYIISRMVGAFIDIALIVLAVIAKIYLEDRRLWLSCTLSPATNALVVNIIDFAFLSGYRGRFSPLLRMCWDGGLVIGFGIAAGFMASYTTHETRLSEQEKAHSSVDGVGVGAAIVVLMLLELINHLGMVRSGFVEWRAVRSGKGRSAV